MKIKLADLMAHPKNPRMMTIKQNADLEESLDSFGLATLPIVNKDMMILGGHQRLRILKTKGVKEVEVRVPNRMLNTKEADELCIRLNKNGGSWDYDALANFFEQDDLKEWGFTDFDLGEWDFGNSDTQETEEIEEDDSPVLANIKIKCPQESEDALRTKLRAILLEFEDTEIS